YNISMRSTALDNKTEKVGITLPNSLVKQRTKCAATFQEAPIFRELSQTREDTVNDHGRHIPCGEHIGRRLSSRRASRICAEKSNENCSRNHRYVY
ncbi:MAG: hypothetical protein WAM14_03510, partial [Candidatus Nitrosopolaris sp.]